MFHLKLQNTDVRFWNYLIIIGHNFGLSIVLIRKCVMTDALESIKTMDNAKEELC